MQKHKDLEPSDASLPTMPPESTSPSDLIYGLNDRPKPAPAFLGAVLSAGFLVKQRGGSPEDIMAMIFGV